MTPDQQMVELVRTGRTAEELSREFECSAQAIRNWVRLQADLDEGRREDGLTMVERDELRRLRRENLQICEEREIPKKTAAWFAREPRHGAGEIFALVKANQAEHRVATMCRDVRPDLGRVPVGAWWAGRWARGWSRA